MAVEWEDAEIEEVLMADGKIVNRISSSKMLFPEVSVSRGGIKYPEPEVEPVADPITEAKKKLIQEVIREAEKSVTYMHPKVKAALEEAVEAGLDTYATIILDEFDKRLKEVKDNDDKSSRLEDW